MCFSPQASFTASALLAIIGIATVRKVKTPPYLLMASIPFLFALQQATEGLLWMNLLHWQSPRLQEALTYIYLMFVYAIWPLLPSFAFYCIESNRVRKRLLVLCTCFGLGILIYAFTHMIQNPKAYLIGHSIFYQLHSPSSLVWLSLVYIVATCGPFLVTHIRILNWAGILIIVSYLLTYWTWHVCVTSVWCFFATLLSLFIYYVIARFDR